MQIVIDIDDETYADIKNGIIYRSVRDVPQESVVAIANGTPLPKGHGRLIDADAYREAWFNSRQFEPMLLLDEASTVIEANKEEQE